nr:hypothetical protein [Tanacetum cinerariifolium]
TFDGNEATKKRKKNLLKQQYGNFKSEGSKTLEQTFNKLQVIVSQLQFMDVEVEKDDLNQKFLTSLAPEWLMHIIVWRNRNDLDTMSLDDLYNHLKVAFCPGLRFVLDCLLSSTTFCLFKDHLLRFAKDKLCQNQNCIAFCLRLHFEEHCVLPQKCCVLNLRFAQEESCVLLKKNLAFCSRRILRFAQEESCVLLKKNLAFCSKNIAFCLSQDPVFFYFIQYTGQAIPEFHDILIQHLESVKKSIDERVHLKREYDSWVNERQMQTTEEKVDTSKALDASSVDAECSRTESKEQDRSSSSGNDAHDDADIRPIYNEEPMVEPQCDSQVDVHNNLSKPVTTHYLSKEREDASAKPHHMIASSNSRISSKNMTRFSSNDMVHNHYQEEAKKKIQERSRNSEPSLMSSARSKSIANGSKPMPRRNTQTSRIWPATKNSFVTTKTVPIAEYPRNSRNDSCVTKFLKEVNSRVKVPSNKIPKRNKPVEEIGVPNKQER